MRIAHHAIEQGQGRLVTIGLGSCVAIMIHDKPRKAAGLAHVLLPEVPPGKHVENRAKFATTAVPLLLEDLKKHGAPGPYTAKLAGGAGLFGQLLSMGGRMGERNVIAARGALAAAGIPVIAEDVGGESGRTVMLDVATGKVTVKTVAGVQRVL